MKKIYFTIQLLLVITFPAHSQLPYYDAIKLRSFVSGGKFEQANQQRVDTILSRYITDPDETVSVFHQNPFMKDYFVSGRPQSSVSGVSKNILSSIGGLDVTNISKGLSLFMIERAKQELNVAFFDQFKRFVENNPEIQKLFTRGNTSFR